ncbi:receptor-type tyrosine-protein phosphatase alpha-like [Biomphalaria glabrata]|uniref:protein-tyrosine-phosphatase n=1 Tax=Biomphalaria glabrata TaxID=6526 RepID=A0A9W3ABC5_BIOGL|nr:receptor-type tyrosine-protein phosphatase alpha-like [Biomphalaria glabrata]
MQELEREEDSQLVHRDKKQFFIKVIDSFACPPGKYGPNCSGTCSQHCFTEYNCDNTNGNCASCKPGYKGDTCNEECQNKTYGYYCMNHCSVGCSNICNKTDGQCNCLNGYKGNMCTEKCPNGTYGDKCAQNCSQFCVPSTCSSENGFCDCLPGYKGDKCDEVCSLGNWGPMCINNCSVHCYNTSCDFQTGSCNYGCIEGFQTANCTEPCNKTHYGKNCVNECSWNCTRSECNSTTGVCEQCVPGRYGNYCDEDCPDGKYGQDCINECSISCKDGCHPVNGTCINGCQDGFLGPFCNATCDENHFGPACSSACSLHCEGVNNNNSRICHSVNGSCLLGCSRDFTGPQCFEAINSGSSPPVGAIVGAAIAALVIIALIIVTVVLWRRKHPKKERTSFKERNITHLILPEKDIEEKVSEEIETPKEDDDPGFIPDATYYNTSSEPLVNMSMPVHELNIYMKSHDKEFFTEQFKKIPQAQDVTTEVAENEKNKVKNRYKNICPYDHSRVHLLINTGKKEGDYINASYIRDNNDKVKFIASQGPNKAVLNDFIRMLWEQHVDIVVMLTNLVEEAKVKCEQYWPESGKVSYGDTKVQVIQAKTFADYTIRTIELNQYNGGTRILTQYHFTSWPDQSVPNSPWALVDLAMKVLAHPTTQPIVVHCSAGVGRTGTFIALHNVLKDAEETNRIDFYSTLVRLRQDRIFMIQTPDQYEFLHRAVQAALICTPTVVSVSECSERVKELLKKEVSGLSKIEKEYRSINLVSKDIRNSQLDDNEVEKSTKEKVYQNTHELKKDGQNRFPNIMPRKFDRPYLVCEQKNMSDYINAVFTPALFKKDQHIITQLPMPQTVSDLWRLVKQYKISLMVAFELEKLGTDKTMTVYLPIVVDSSLALGNIEIHCTAINDKDLWEEQILKVRNEKSKSDSQDVVHLKCKDTEMDVKKLLSLILKIRAYTAYTSGRTLFLCRNGATFSGLCSVLCTVLDRLDEDAKVSVPLVVGAMKTVRPEVIPNLEQYRIVYEVLERYCTTASPYTNVGGEKLPLTIPLTTPLTTPLTIPSHIINNPTFDENSTDPSSVYNNV